MTRQQTIIVAGALANKPWNGGEAWVRLSWLLGFRRLGYRVFFIEQIEPQTCVDELGRPASFAASTNLAFFRHIVRAFGLGDSAALICGDGESFEGISRANLLRIGEDADLLVNISGHLDWPPLFERIGCRAYVDIDPGFTQFWHEQGNPGARLSNHDVFFTIAENIGRDDCSIPTCGLTWHAVRQPVVLADWPACAALGSARAARRFTTVASWRGSFGPVSAHGRTFGVKAHEFRKVLSLPGRLPSTTLEIALAIHAGDSRDLTSLKENGWHIADPSAAAGDPAAFRRYVQGSDAEFSVAQGIYVDTHSGWVSDRTIRYLASARPAIVQDTGLASEYTSEGGLLAFRDIEGAVDAITRVTRDYGAHARAARALAERCFDSDRVLPAFLRQVGMSQKAVVA
jgi:hypothetical protein